LRLGRAARRRSIGPDSGDGDRDAGSARPGTARARGRGVGGADVSAWAVIPVKGFERGKSRLSGVLEGSARAALARRLFEHVLDAAVAAVDRVLVATDSDEVAAAARGALV